jgi:hypothetical protein
LDSIQFNPGKLISMKRESFAPIDTGKYQLGQGLSFMQERVGKWKDLWSML